jgi:S1-C subfamily serine protease
MPGKCLDRALAGSRIAVRILMTHVGENRVLASLLGPDEKSPKSSREQLAHAFGMYWRCRRAPSVPENDCIALAEGGEPVAIESMRVRAASASRDIEAFRWTAALLRAGDTRDIDQVIDTFEFGGVVPRNEPRLREAIEVGATRGHMRSMLAKAAYLQDVDPATSRSLYLEAARKDDCFGQAMLAASYLNGVFTEVNEAKAYFWWALLMRDRYATEKIPPYIGRRISEAYGRWPDALDRPQPPLGFNPRICGAEFFASRAFAQLASAEFAQEVRDLLAYWTPGSGSPEQLDRFADTRLATAAKARVERTTTSVRPASTSEAGWRPFRFAKPYSYAEELRAEAVYERVAKSVYVVVAGPSLRASASGQGTAQGSAVAVDSTTVLTNCHIIDGRPDVRVIADGRSVAAKVIAADIPADTCIVSVSEAKLNPVIGVRMSRTIRVGEEVFAIGSPKGFTNSMSTGIVSQLRTAAARSYLQTTAQISAGSSGGGLFDNRGNLIGITTFKVRDAEGLNFAIAVEEFLERH